LFGALHKAGALFERKTGMLVYRYAFSLQKIPGTWFA
jgi:hypothetical protein